MTPLVMTRKNGSSLNMETILILYCIIKGYVPIKNLLNILGKGSCSFSCFNGSCSFSCFNMNNLKFVKFLKVLHQSSQLIPKRLFMKT